MLKKAQLFLACTLALFSPADAGTLENLIQSGVLPKAPSKPVSSTELINRVVNGNDEILISLTVRPAYARAPIHTHPFGGSACVLQGEETLYIENESPIRVTAPGCYYMPANKRMTAYNSGSTTSMTYDIFHGPKDFTPMNVVEKGYFLQFSNQFRGQNQKDDLTTTTHQH
jgi:quercetin dioxygenase-like cupin family protein